MNRPLVHPKRRGCGRAGRVAAVLFAVAGLLLAPKSAWAVPSFARQLNVSCIVCHTEYPLLTDFGRQFKLGGYTLSAEQTRMPPLAVMLQPSYTHTSTGQPGGAAPGFGDNNNAALTQASIFYAGRLLGPYAKDLLGSNLAAFVNKIGVFAQVTYDGIGKTWAWDNTEVRYASAGAFGRHPASYGFYANNNPTMQDPWNSTPAWGFPFTGSGLAPSPAAATMIDGGLAQQVAGVGAYAMIDNAVYLDVAGYHTFGARLQKSLGVDPAGEAQIGGLAPYWRLAHTALVGGGAWEVGIFGLAANTYPGRDASEGRDRTVDYGFDTQYQVTKLNYDVTAMASWIYERQTWSASRALGEVENATNHLGNFKATVSYLRAKTYGVTVQYFNTRGSADALLYPDSPSNTPDSAGFIFQLNYLPLNHGGGPAFWPRSNVKFALQYIDYLKFDGARHDYDGSGRNARDNNTVYAEAWILF